MRFLVYGNNSHEIVYRVSFVIYASDPFFLDRSCSCRNTFSVIPFFWVFFSILVKYPKLLAFD